MLGADREVLAIKTIAGGTFSEKFSSKNRSGLLN
jgi:hypothetical protein